MTPIERRYIFGFLQEESDKLKELAKKRGDQVRADRSPSKHHSGAAIGTRRR